MPWQVTTKVHATLELQTDHQPAVSWRKSLIADVCCRFNWWTSTSVFLLLKSLSHLLQWLLFLLTLVAVAHGHVAGWEGRRWMVWIHTEMPDIIWLGWNLSYEHSGTNQSLLGTELWDWVQKACQVSKHRQMFCWSSVFSLQSPWPLVVPGHIRQPPEAMVHPYLQSERFSRNATCWQSRDNLTDLEGFSSSFWQ